MTYHHLKPRWTTCDDCGERTMCEVMIADSRERETGYLDEVILCGACIDKAAELRSERV